MQHTSVLLGMCLIASLAQGTSVEWICSTEDQPWKPMPSPSLVEKTEPPAVFVKPDRTYQTIDGFGGSFNELGWVALSKAKKSDAQQVIQALFGDEGCAFTLARIPIGASDFGKDFYSLAEKPGDYELKHFSIERDREELLPYIKAAMAVRPDLQCWASPWSPPMWMKNVGDLNPNKYDGGTLRWEPKVLNTYADYFSRWIKAYRAEGVNLYAVLPQNEPNQDQPFPSCVWTGDQLAEFISDYLAPTLKKQNKPIEVWVGFNGDPQFNGDDVNDRLISVMEDSDAYDAITGMAFQYDSRNQTAVANELYPEKKLMQSESTCYNGDNTWEQGMLLYGQIKQHIGGGANQYFAWNMVLNETGKSSWDWPQNALVTVNRNSGEVTYNGEFYVYKHFSHFVKPGAKRVISTGWWGDKIAFVNPDGSVVLVMANSSDNDFEASIEIAGLSGKNTMTVEFPARSINTLVIALNN